MYINCTNLYRVYVKYYKSLNFKTDHRNYWGPSLLLCAYRKWSSVLLCIPTSAVTYRCSDSKHNSVETCLPTYLKMQLLTNIKLQFCLLFYMGSKHGTAYLFVVHRTSDLITCNKIRKDRNRCSDTTHEVYSFTLCCILYLL
jgi:hypothetical protein